MYGLERKKGRNKQTNIQTKKKERKKERNKERKKMIVCLVGFYGISTLKQFSLAWVHSLIVKNISISNYSSSYI